MKMSNEDFAALKAACEPILAKMDMALFRQHFSAKRIRWDVLHASRFPTNRLYNAGLNDENIDTALRKIIL